MRFRITAALVLTLLSASARAADPAAAINRAREEINAGKPAVALRLLREATPAAAGMTDLKQRSAALSALHFYSAVAASALGDKEQAAGDLRALFLYSPNSKLDASRYRAEFVRLFNEVQRNVTRGRANPASFDDAYPGYPPSETSSAWPLANWGASSEFQILAAPKEKEEWGRLADDAARRAFVDAFWAERDPDPATRVNEMRIEILQRIAFADVAFVEGADARGSLTDRGRVFVLLGPPKRVRIRPLTRREVGSAPRRTLDAGNAMEEWTYFREQLPKKIPHNELLFQFISTGGSLVRRMQHEFLADKAVLEAPNALRRD
jgi:GWxTD domain-containing protein